MSKRIRFRLVGSVLFGTKTVQTVLVKVVYLLCILYQDVLMKSCNGLFLLKVFNFYGQTGAGLDIETDLDPEPVT